MTERTVELLELSGSLGRYAAALPVDANASLLLVHRALSAAFAERPDRHRPGLTLESSLRDDVRRAFEADRAIAARDGLDVARWVNEGGAA